MSFELTIVFTGLCLFVPERGSEKKMHVLLPDASGHRHLVRLYYDKCHGAPGGDFVGALEVVNLDRLALLVPRVAGDADDTLPSQIVNLKDLTGRAVDPKQIGIDPKKVLARVTLGSGQIESTAPGAFWKFGSGTGVSRCMTHQVIWTVRVDGTDSIRLETRKFKSGAAGSLPTLHKTKNTEEIVLYVFNATKEDLPAVSPGNGHRADHFMAYYEVLNGSTTLGSPVLRGDVGECDAGTAQMVEVSGRSGPKGADPYRCMVAGGELG